MFSKVGIFALEETFFIMRDTHARIHASAMQMKTGNKQVFL